MFRSWTDIRLHSIFWSKWNCWLLFLSFVILNLLERYLFTQYNSVPLPMTDIGMILLFRFWFFFFFVWMSKNDKSEKELSLPGHSVKFQTILVAQILKNDLLFVYFYIFFVIWLSGCSLSLFQFLFRSSSDILNL